MAPRSKTRNDESSGSESDSDAPETISLSQSKKTIKKLDSSREDAIKAGRQNQRLRNQQRDKALKERAERNKEVVQKTAKGKPTAKDKGKQKEELPEDEEEASEASDDDDDDDEEEEEEEEEEEIDPNGLEARMLRAMKEAQDEESGSDDEEDLGDFEGTSLDEDEESSGDEEDDDDSDEENSNPEFDEDEEEDEEEEQPLPPPKKSQKTKFNPDHLPDEIFEAAFASQPKKRTFDDTDADAPKKSISRPSKKRKSNTKSNTPKDIVIGSRAIRILPTTNHPDTPSLMPSRKVKRFVDRTLSLKAGKQRGKGWERRSVNIGVLRRAGGPAANFVRGQA